MSDQDFRLTIPWDEVFIVEPNYAGWRLDVYLAQKIHRATRSQVRRILMNSDVQLAGKPARTSSIVRAGDEVRLPRIERIDPMTPTLDSIRVLLDQNDLVVINKPSGTLVHRNSTEVSRTVDMWANGYCPDERLEPVHRTDRDTSGVLVLGRGLETIRALRAAFENVDVEKVYVAVVEDPERRWAVGDLHSFETPLGPAQGSVVRLRMGHGDLPCATHVRCMHRTTERAFLEVRIEQGRQHQIRAHLSLHGTPVTGDKLYGMGDDFFEAWLQHPGHPNLTSMLATRWHALHAWKIRIPHRGRRIGVTAPIPEQLAELVEHTPCELSVLLDGH
jgi:23S rRNA pseudouridine1911/1915/1917 synthase